MCCIVHILAFSIAGHFVLLAQKMAGYLHKTAFEGNGAGKFSPDLSSLPHVALKLNATFCDLGPCARSCLHHYSCRINLTSAAVTTVYVTCLFFLIGWDILNCFHASSYNPSFWKQFINTNGPLHTDGLI